MALNKKQKEEIRKILKDKLITKLREYEESDDMNKPFYFHLFSKENVYLGSLLHSTYTWMGSQWEEFGKIIAQNNYDVVKKRVKIDGYLNDKTRSKISTILDELDRGNRTPNIKNEKQEILPLIKQSKGEKTSQQVDLYLEKDDIKIFIEIKSVKPNKNEVKGAKSDLLKLIGMYPNSYIILAMPYNPYFGESYDRWTLTKFFSRGDDFLIGKEFWNLLGGENTYSDLLNVFSEVGKEIKTEINRFLN